MNLFENYAFINAEDIVRANIRSTNIEIDADNLIGTLKPLIFLANLEDSRRANLHRNIIQKLQAKPRTLELLKCIGYDLNPTGDYGYQHTSDPEVISARQSAANELDSLVQYLTAIKTNPPADFKIFIQAKVTRKESVRQQSATSPSPERHRHHSSPSQRRHRSPSPSPPPATTVSETRLPDYVIVQENNEKTIDAVREFKKSLVTRHTDSVAHSFIRRKLLTFLFKQKYPDAFIVGNEEVDGTIDYQVSELKAHDSLRDSTTSDEVYYECLLRTNYQTDRAIEMLTSKRPNLIPPPEPELPRGPTTTTLANSLGSVQNRWTLLTDYANEHNTEQVLLQEGDEWKNTAHVITAILQFRKKFPSPSTNLSVVNKMYRLIYNELSLIIDPPPSELKIEIIANVLCEIPSENLEHFNMTDLRDIIQSCGNMDIPDDYDERVKKFFSRECPICFGSYTNSYMQEMFLCTHKCCLECVKNHYRNAVAEISDLESLNKLTCFEEAHPITEDTKMNFFTFLGTKMNQWFTDERRVLDLYHENLYMATRDTQDMKCGNPRCTAFFSNDNNNEVGRVQCPHPNCNFQQCRRCGRKWNNEHRGKNCQEYADWLRENDPDDPEVQLNKYLNTAGMMCPNEQCRAVFEYQPGGCEHFRCPQCSTEFCRICSALFYNPQHNTICPRQNCSMKKTLHAHCCLNCFREIRDADNDEIIQLLTAHRVNVNEELRQKPQASSPKCPVEGCTRAASATCENRFCDVCYKQFLCLLVWRNEIEPWVLYTDNNLRQKLLGASVNIPANATRENLINLAKQHLKQFLGKPKKIQRK